MRVLLIIFIFGVFSEVHSYEWPLPSSVVAKSFGTYEADDANLGISLEGQNTPVLATDSGEIIFYNQYTADQENIISSLGNFTALQHPNNIIAVYGSLKSTNITEYSSTLKGGYVLGKAQSTGRNNINRIVFLMYDTKRDAWINPLLILPVKAETQTPVIQAILLVRDAAMFRLGEPNASKTVAGRRTAETQNLLAQGWYSVIAEVYDYTKGGGQTKGAPYSISLLIDGSEKYTIRFEGIYADNGKIVLHTVSGKAKNLDDVLKNGGYYNLGSYFFSQGRAMLQIQVYDFAGNVKTSSWIIRAQ